MIADWGSPTAAARLTIDGVRTEPGPDFRQGVVIDSDGTYALVIWLGLEANAPRRFVIE